MADGGTAAYEEMSPTLLAQQPVNTTERQRDPKEWWNVVFAYLEARYGMLRSWRWASWAYWAVLARFFLPFRYIWLVTANRMWRGHNVNDAIIDSTGQLAVRTCSSGVWTGLTSPSRPWFKLGIALPWIKLGNDMKAWLEDTEQRLYTVLHQSNFYSAMAQAFKDMVVFGGSPVIIYEDSEDVIRLYVPCAGEFYWQLGSRLSVDTNLREFTLTVQQIVDQFRVENCPDNIQRMWTEGGAALDREYVVCHMIEPNFPIAKKGPQKGEVRPVPSKWTWREVYWLKGIKSARPLCVRGFQVKPFMTLRWATVSNDAYARSPCMDALGDVKQVQTETYRKAEFIEKGVRPPMGADMELKNEPASVMPSMITYMATSGSKKGFWPLFQVEPQWLAGLTADIDKVNARIDHCLFVDLFMAISRMEGVQPRNELELTKRDLERLQELGPVIELAEQELNAGILRILDIMQRRRLTKPMPASMVGLPLKINYLSILKLAQRSAQSIAMKDVMQTAGEMSSAAKAGGLPDPLRILDLDKAMREYADMNNWPQSCVFTEQEVQQHDQIRQKEMQKAQAPQQAMAGVQAAKTLADTQLPSGGSALGALMGQGGAPGAPPS